MRRKLVLACAFTTFFAAAPAFAADPHVWKLTGREFAFMPVFMYRMTSLGKLTLYGAIGPRVYLLQSTVEGSANEAAIDETTEQSTKVGVGVPVDVEHQLDLIRKAPTSDHRTACLVQLG